MEPESPKTRLNHGLRVQSWKSNNDYKSVSVLVIYWRDSDDKGFKDEAHALGQLFADDFHYTVEYFAIPSLGCQLKLDEKISNFLDANGQPDNLIIIHYGGHGDADDEMHQERLAVWAANSSGNPKVEWSVIQSKFRFVDAEILLLLDCCFGAQAARGVRMIASNVELVAACAMRVMTARPGSRSFTTVLIEELRRLLGETKKAKIQDVVNGLASRCANVRETPVRFSGLSRGTICLEPLISPSQSTQTKQEKELVTLKVSLSETLDDLLVNEMIDWLNLLRPRQVWKLTVEDVVSSTCHVHDYIFHKGGGSTSTSFQQLSQPGKNEILSAWDGLKAHLTVIGAQLRRQSSSTDQSCQSLDGSPITQVDSVKPLQEVENRLLSLQRLIERNVMALPDLYKDKDALLTAIEDTALRDLGFLPMLELRLKARFPLELDPAMKAEHVVKSAPTQQDSFSTLVKEDVDGLGLVLVEYKGYGTKDATSDNIADSKKQMTQLTSLLQSSSSTEYRTLHCIRWFHEVKNTRFGLVFKTPSAHDDFISLRDAIKSADRTQRPTLGQRYSIAFMIGDALLRWHTAGWVHQGIASYNIIFFIRNRSVDYHSPYLCGFEYARPSGAPSTSRRVQDFKLNVYRHPSRQGNPSKYHTKRHDIYSYGVLLLEIGLWELAEHCFETWDKNSISPMAMQRHLLMNSKLRLGHYVGKAYQKAAERCLTLDFAVDQDDDAQSQLAMKFEDVVLKNIPSRSMID